MIINPDEVTARTDTNYPDVFKYRVAGRIKKKLGDAAGLTNFGVNLVTLPPGCWSALRHYHDRQDEFIYILEGEVILIMDEGEQLLTPGMMAGFPAGKVDGHHLVNRSQSNVIYLEIGDRSPNDVVTYPDEDLIGRKNTFGWQFFRRNNQPL